jgi:hypothetical protein
MSAPNAVERAFMVEWLTRSIRSIETLPPSASRNLTLAQLHERVESYRSTNVIQFPGNPR